MFNIFQKRKLEELSNKIELNSNTGEVKLYKVSWIGRKGEYSSDRHRIIKAFVTKDDAQALKKDLEAAAKLLQNEEDLDIQLTEEEI